MNNALLRNLTLEEAIRELDKRDDPLVKTVLPTFLDLLDLHEEIEKHDIELPLVVKDYQNFGMKLNDFLQTKYWQDWDESNRNQLFCTGNPYDRERAERLEVAAIDGCEGSTHGEVIQDWLDCLDDRDADLEFGPLTVQRLMTEAERTRDWFEEQGAIDHKIG